VRRSSTDPFPPEHNPQPIERKTMSKPKQTRLSYVADANTYKLMKLLAISNDTTVSDLLCIAVKNFLDTAPEKVRSLHNSLLERITPEA
jgi:hypothetical protein